MDLLHEYEKQQHIIALFEKSAAHKFIYIPNKLINIHFSCFDRKLSFAIVNGAAIM